MNENKLSHSVIGAVVSWLFAFLSWSATHPGFIAMFFAVAASIYTIQAARETTKLRKAQRRKLETENKEPETDL